MTGMRAVEDGWQVVCEEHGLDRYVDDDQKALALLAEHQREAHGATEPDRPLMPAEAARFLLLTRSSPLLAESTQIAVLGLWEQLTGLYGDEALTYARDLAARPGTVYAHIPTL